MILRPPLYNFRPFTPDRVPEVRAEREMAWARALAPTPKKPRKSTVSKTPPALVGVPPEMQALMRAALANLSL